MSGSASVRRLAPEEWRTYRELRLRSIIEWAAAAGVHWLVLSVAIGNTAATRVYERAGFVPIGEPGQICDGSQVVAQAMRLRIS